MLKRWHTEFAMEDAIDRDLLRWKISAKLLQFSWHALEAY